ADGPFHRRALERNGDHPTVLRVHVAFVDDLAVAGQERVLLVPKLRVRLSEHENRILGVASTRVKEIGAPCVLRRIERLGRGAHRSKGERIRQPSRSVGERATEGPCFVLRAVTVEAIEVERAKMELDRRIAEEWRQLLHALSERGTETPEQRGGGFTRAFRRE